MNFTLRYLTVAFFFFLTNAMSAQTVQFKVALLPDGITYRVSMKPSVSWSAPQNNVQGAQVTLLAPTGGFQISNFTNISGFWTVVPTVVAPIENPGFDYFNIYLASSTAMTFVAGQETHLFTFQKSGNCTGAVELINNNTDPFMPPNSQSLNVGNYIATQGGGGSGNNLWISNYDQGHAICANPSCLLKYKLTQNGSTYKVSMISLVTWNAPDNTVASMQVTVKTPTGGFQMGNITNFIGNAQFAQTSHFPNLANSGNDYFAFTLQNAGTTGIPFQQGQEVDLFTFENTGTCGAGGNVFLMDNLNDPNSNNQNANVGQQVTTLGYGSNDAPICLDASFSAPCTAPAPTCLMQYQLLPLGNGKYQFAVIPNITWNNGTANITSSMQVTVKAPTGFAVSNLVNLTGATFALTSTYANPTQDPGNNDYFSFTLQNQGTNANAYNIGVTLPLFTFENTGDCGGGGAVLLIDENDPFLPPASNANVGQQMTTLGYGANDVPICLAANSSAACSATCLMEYQLTALGNGKYQFAVIPNITWNNGTANITSSMQVTVKAPTGFSVANLTNLTGANFALTSTYADPAQDPGANDYFSFTLQNQGTNANNYVNGVPLPLFTFENNGSCGSGGQVKLIASNDPFLPPNSSANVGQQMTTLGYGTNDVPICLAANNSAACSVAPATCLMQYELTALGNGKYQFSVIPNVNWNNGTDNATASMQATVKAPTGFVISNLVNLTGAIFDLTSTYSDPAQDPGANDYFSFTLQNQGTTANAYNIGVPIPLFTFENTGACSGGLVSLINENDPFLPPASNANVGQQMTTFGYGANDVPICLAANNSAACSSTCLVEYKLTQLTNGLYRVSMIPHINWTSPDNITASQQVTIKAPTGGFEIQNINSLVPGAAYDLTSQYPSPSQAPTWDYFSFTLQNAGTSALTYQNGVEVPLFTFENGGSCSGSTIYLIDDGDPFLPPNSNANVGQQLTTFGYGTNDVPICLDGNGSAPCSAPLPGCLINLKLELNDDCQYQVSMIPDTTWASGGNITKKAKVTIRVPSGCFSPTNLTNFAFGADWVLAQTVVNPPDNPGYTYYCFNLATVPTVGIPYQDGVPVPMFAFENAAACCNIDSIRIMQNDDPMADGNTLNINLDNQWETSGTDPAGVTPCLVGTAALPCQSNGTVDLVASAQTICNGESVVLNATAGYATYNWSPSVGLSCNNCQTPTASPTTTTTYILTVTTANNCAFTDQVVVTVNNGPTIVSVTPDSPVSCVSNDGTITISATGANLQFSINNGVNWQASNIFQNLGAGTYTVLVRNSVTTCETAHAQNPVILTAPTAPTVNSVTPTDPTDCNLNDGTITVSATGTNLQFSKDGGATWQASNIFQNLAAGTFQIKVRNSVSNCQTNNIPTVLTAPVAPSISSISATPQTDCGQNNGSITVNSTPASGLQYSIDNGTTWQTSNIFQNLAAGSYQIKIRNGDGTCAVANGSATTVAAPAMPNITAITPTNPSSCTAPNGSLTITATGGVGVLEYSIDGTNWQTNPTFNGLAAGTYTAFVRNQDNTCPNPWANNPVVLVSVASPNVLSATPTAVSSCTVNNGTIAVNATSGTPPYQYSLNNTTWQAGNIFQNLPAGTYDIYVRNANGTCPTQFNQQVVVGSPSNPTIVNVVPTHPTDCNLTNGSLVVSAVGAGLQYSINNGANWQTSNTFNGLGDGVFTVLVRNTPSLCLSNPETATLTAPSGASISNITASPVNTCDTNDGQIVITATGGTAPLSYSIDGGATWQTGNIFQNLAAGNYNIRVRNAGGTCVVAASSATLVDAPNQPSFVSVNASNPTACGLTNGSISISATGGIPQLEYSIDGTNWQTNPNFTGLAGGSYTVWVRNQDNTCPIPWPANPVVLTQPTAPTIASVTPQNPTACGTSNGTISINATGGIAPLQYSLDGNNWQAGNIFQNLAAGTYSVFVRNANGTCPVQNSTSTVLTNPGAPVLVSATPTNPTTCGTNNGQISISATGANLQYSINNGSTWQASNFFQNLVAGNYTVVVQNSLTNCLSNTQALVLTAPAAPVISSANATPTTDCNLTNGTITVNATGGTPPLEYSRDGTNWQTNNVFQNVPAGNYTISVRNSNGSCATVFANTVVVGQPNSATITSATPTNPACGQNNGSISVSATGGIAPLEYSKDGTNWQTGSIFQNLAAGTYTVRVRNANGTCVVIFPNPVVLTAPASANIVSVNAQNPSVCGTDNGSITVNATGGTPPLEYSINGTNWQTSNVFQNLAAGSYQVSVRNANGTCPIQNGTATVLTAPATPVLVSATPTNPSDCASANGQIVVSATGANLQFSINNGSTWQVGNTFSGLAAGSFTVVVRNSLTNCLSNSQVLNLTAPASPTISSANATPASDCNLANGTITINAAGGTPPLQFSVNGTTWQTGNVFQNVAAGSYQISVRNANGTCPTTFANAIVVGQPASANIVSATPTNPSCGSNNGSISISATGGIAPLEYSLDGTNWQTASVFQNLAAGNYTVRVRNANGTCTTIFANPVVLTAPATASIVSITPQNPTTCGTNNGSISVSATGGTAPLEYSINGTTWQTSNVFSNLAAGSYTVGVRNSNGTCPVSANAPTVLVAPQIPVVQSVTPQNPSVCNGTNGSVSIVATGSNLQYSIDNGSTWQTGNIFQNLAAGTFNVLVRNSLSNCQTTPQQVVLTAPPAPVVTSAVPTNVSDCGLSNGSISVSATGGLAPLEYSLDNLNFQTSTVFNALPAGTYTIWVRNFNGTCTVQHPNTVTISAPAVPNISLVSTTQPGCGAANGSITITATGGVAPLSFSINNGLNWQTSNVFQNLAAGNYTVLVRNSGGGCVTANVSNPVVLVAGNPPSIVSAVPQNPTGCGTNNGTITVSATGGTPPLEYSKDGTNWQTSNIFQNLAAGSYTISVRNANGTCANPFANPVVLTAPTGATILQVLTFNPQGCGINNGTVQIVATGNNLQYSINNGSTFQTSQIFTGLAAGTYQIVVSDPTTNCTATSSATLTAPTAPTIPGFTPTPVSNCGLANGSVNISATGGQPPYQYSINGGATWQTSNIFTGLTAGNYVVLVRNSDGSCATASPLISINTPAQPSVLSVNASSPVSCANQNGAITISASGGIAPLEYSIDGVNWQSSNTFSNLTSGTYFAQVRNANGSCSTPYAGNPLVLNAPISPAITLVTAAAPTDCGLSNGSISVSATSGMPPFDYSIDGGATWQVSNFFQNLAAGNYNVVVRNQGGQGCQSAFIPVVFNVLSQPTVTNLTKTDPLGCGLVSNENGTITVTATGGQAPIQYSLDGLTWQFSNIFTGLAAGNYTVRLRNGNGTCIYTHPTPLVLTAPASPTVVSATATPATCGANNGTISINATGGTSPLSYSIDGIFWQASNVFQNLPAGNYTVFVRNANGSCATPAAANPVVVGQNAGATLTNVNILQPATCGATGTITVAATGGTAPLEFSINGGATWQTATVFPNLAGGNYVVMVRNADDSCPSGNVPVSIISKPPPVILQVSSSNLTACGSANGTISIFASGGEAPLEYSIDGVNWFTTNVFSGLSAGNYTPQVRNFDNTCVVAATSVVTLTEPNSLTIASVVPTNPVGCNQNNGNIVVSVTGGGVQYSIDGGVHWQNSGTFNNLAAGSYNVFVRKINGTCPTGFTQNPVVLTAPAGVSIVQVLAQNPQGCGVNDGTIQIIASGTNLKYSINNGASFQSSPYFSGIAAGNYQILISDATGGCTANSTATLTAPTAPTIPGFTPSPVSNCGLADGSISVSPTGGVPPYQFSINAGATWQTSNIFTGLTAGNYVVLVRNSNGSCATASSLITIGTPALPNIFSANGTSPTNCTLQNGSITVTASGGISPLEYSINGVNWQTSNTFTGLSSGSYSVFVRNANGTCSTPFFGNPIVLNAPAAPAITSVNASAPTDCGQNNGSISVSATGGTPPFEYSKDGGATWQVGNIFQNLSAGNYNIVVRNTGGQGCSSSSVPVVFNVLSQPTVSNLTKTDPLGCGSFDGTITVSATGGVAPLQYSLDGLTWQFSNIFTGLTAGNYTVRVRNANGTCVFTSPNQLVLTAPANPTVTSATATPASCGANSGTITVSATGGTPPFSYSIDGIFWQSSNVFQNLPAGSFTVFVRNANGSCATAFASNPVVVGQNSGASLTNVTVSQPANCGGTGSISVAATGGTAPLEFSINGGATWQTGTNFNNLTAGNYVVMVRNADDSCPSGSVPVSLQARPLPAIVSVSSSNLTACGAGNGSISIFGNGGQTPLEYSIDGVNWFTTNVFAGLAAGNYVPQIRNFDNSCVVLGTPVSLTEPTSLTIASVTPSNSAGCGQNTGSIVVSVTGGGVQYSIDGIHWQTSGTFNNLAAGSYQVFVRKLNGTCATAFAQNPVVLTAPGGVNIISVQNTQPESCLALGETDGTITIHATGTPAPLRYSIDGGATYQFSNFFSGLTGGSYVPVVSAIDNSCSASGTQVVFNFPVAPQILTATATGTTDCGPASGGTPTGGITISATGGTPPLQFSINNGQSWQAGNTFSGLLPGFYSIKVRNANEQCEQVLGQILQVSEPATPTILNAVGTAPTSCGQANGSIIVTATGTNLRYSLDGTNWQTSNIFQNLFPGSYTVRVRSTDALNCIETTAQPVDLTPAAAANITKIDVDPLSNCGLTDGKIVITATGGAQPLGYSINGGVSFSNNNIFENLPAGNYDIVVRNFDGSCPITGGTAIIPVLASPDIVSVVPVSATDCGGTDGKITVSATSPSGVGGLQYSLNGIDWQNSPVFPNLTPGNYVIHVRNATGTCAVQSAAVTVGQPTAPTISSATGVSPTACGATNGSITVSATGGTAPLSYSIDGINWQTGSVFSNLPPGSYTVFVRNANATCATPASSLVILTPGANSPSILNVNVQEPANCGQTGTVTVTVTGGTTPYQFSKDGGLTWQTSNIFQNLAAGSYEIVVRNADGTCPTVYPPVTISSKIAPQILSVTLDPPTDCNFNNASIAILATGGQQPLQYSIDSMQTWHSSNLFQNLPPAAYYVFIRNADGSCTTAYFDNPVVNCDFDLALKKTLSPGQAGTVRLGYDTWFTIKVYNQGFLPAANIEVTDYLPEGTILSGNTANSIWTVVPVGAGGLVQKVWTVLPGILQPGDSASVQIAIRVIYGTPGSTLVNRAEVSGATDEAGGAISDVDSDPDDTNGNDNEIDNETNDDGDLDEDDEDPANIVLVPGDPIGYIYCDKTGAVLTGGKIVLTSAPVGGEIYFSVVAGDTLDGRNGKYKWVTNGVQGTYSTTYVHPLNFPLSTSCPPQSGSPSPSSLDGSTFDKDGLVNGHVELGSEATAGSLINKTCAFNPYWLSFTIGSGDTTIVNTNNIPVQCGFIGAITCIDQNGNGIPEPGEPTLDGVTVQLFTCSGTTPIASTVTNNGGKYKFDGLVAGSYKLKFLQPSGFNFALDGNGQPVNIDLNGFTSCITLNFGECDTSKNVCFVACPTATATASALQICPGGSTQLFGSASSGTFSWSPAAGLSCTNCQQPIATPTATTSYILQVTDGNCISKDTVIINVLPVPTAGLINVSSQNPTTCGASNGSITVSTSQTGVQFSINGGATWQATGSFTGLAAGTYTVAVRFTGSACSTLFPGNPVVLNSGGAPNISNVAATQPNNCDTPNGQITISATGANLEYSINNGVSFQSSNIFQNLAAGTYKIVVRAAGNSACTATWPDVVLVLQQPIVSNVIVNANCQSGQNSLTIVATGGQPPLEYSINGTDWFTQNTFNNLASGFYNVWVRNFNSTCETPWAQNPVGICAFDLALKKTLAPGQTSTVALGDTIDYVITIYNQGSIAAHDISVVDYLPAGMKVVTPGWTQNFTNQMATTTVAGPIAAGGSLQIPISAHLVVGGPGTMLKNVAEIKDAEDAQGNHPDDIDSNPDMISSNDNEIDNVTNNGGGDEDDADPAEVMLNQFDPSGYIYCNKTGKILTGGTVQLVSGPIGGQLFFGTDGTGKILDGNTGMYQVFTNGVPGVYTLGYSHPNGYPLSTTCLPHAGTFNPAGNDNNPVYDNDGLANGIIHFGSGATNGVLNDINCADNHYFLKFYLDPQETTLIANNNIPVSCGILGGRVCLDNNNDGQPTPGEPGAANVTVQLIDCSNPQNPIVVQAVLTNANGEYQFDGLVADNYQIKVLAPSGYSVIGAGFDTDGTSDCLPITFTTCDLTNNVCLSFCPVIHQVISVNPNCPPGDDGLIVISAQCLGTLQYSIDGGTTWQASNVFPNLPPGTYTIVVSSGACQTTWQLTITLDCDNAPDDAGLIGNAFQDCGATDGVREIGEDGLANVQVTLTGNGQNLKKNTDANGLFTFENVPPGTYTLTFGKPAGTNFTTQNAGSDDAKDSDVSPTGTVSITLLPGQTLTNVAAGFKDILPPVITFSNPKLQGHVAGDTILMDCNNLVPFGLADAKATDNWDSDPDLKFVEKPILSFPSCQNGYLAIMHCGWVATDDCGNTSEIEFVMAVQDKTAPQFVGVPSNLILNVGDPVPTPANVKVFDFCDPTVTNAVFAETQTQNGCQTVITRKWTATDHCGNVATASHTITIGNGNAPVLAISAKTNATCNASNGSCNLTPATLAFAWSDGGTGASRNNLPAGNFTVTATDAAGCTASLTVLIEKTNQNVAFTVGNLTDAACGNANGAASLTPATLTFAWSDGGSGASRNNLAAGNYQITATDASGCTGTANFTINETGNLNPTIAATTADFCDQNNGTAVLFPVNLTYNWSDGGTGANRFGLAGGTYTVTATNGTPGCTATLTVVIQEQNGVAISVSSNKNETCFGNDGAVTLSPATGVTYSWSDGGTGATRTDLDADIYIVTGTSPNGCTGMIMVEVMRDVMLQVGVTSTDSATCAGNDGQAVLFPTTGITFNWSDGGTGATRNNLVPGVYVVTATTPNCSEAFTVSIGLDCSNTGCTTPVFESTIITPAKCSAADGAAAVFVVGDEANFTYSWLPNNGSSNAAGNSRIGLLPGIYLVTVKPLGFDSCDLKVNMVVPNDTVGCGTPPKPDDFTSLPDGLLLFDCKKGSYQHCMDIRFEDFKKGYSVTDNGGQFLGGIKACNVHEFTFYEVDLLTSSGSMGPFEVAEWFVNGTKKMGTFADVAGLIQFLNQNDLGAAWKFDTLEMRVISESPKTKYSNLQVKEIPTGNIVILETSNVFDERGTILEMPEGDYHLVVVHTPTGLKDTVDVTVHCLTTDTIVRNILVKELVSIDLDDSELLGASEGARIVQENILTDVVQLMPSGKNKIEVYASKSGTEHAILVLQDERGVIDTTYLIINANYKDIPADSVYVFNAVSPNEDGQNDVWTILNIEKYSDNKVQVYNRWGERVFDKENYQNDWNARWNDQYLPDGTYFYLINYDGGKRLTGYLQIQH